MTRVQMLEREIKELTDSELALFRKWFQEYDSGKWDREIEEDALAGRFNQAAEKALADHATGRTKEF